MKTEKEILEKIKDFKEEIESSKKYEHSRGQIPEMTGGLKVLEWFLED